MPESSQDSFIAWWTKSFPTAGDSEWHVLLGRLVMAFALGLIIAAVYRWTSPPRARTPSFVPTLVLLCILIAMVTQVIGDNLARAFSLVGALSIVRFRTNVRDTRDTAFVIFVVIVGMAVGSGHLTIALVGIPVAAAAARLLKDADGTPVGRHHWRLVVRVATGINPDKLLAEVLPRWFERYTLTASGTTKQGTAVDLTYEVLPRRDVPPPDCIAGLNAVEGVQGVEFTRL
jgi:hypothetical protein